MLWYCYVSRPDRKVRGNFITEKRVLDLPGSTKADARLATARAATAFRSSMERTFCMPVPLGEDFREHERAAEMLARQTKTQRSR